jgi:hypothetical protein
MVSSLMSFEATILSLANQGMLYLEDHLIRPQYSQCNLLYKYTSKMFNFLHEREISLCIHNDELTDFNLSNYRKNLINSLFNNIFVIYIYIFYAYYKIKIKHLGDM